jgi:DNA-binding MarR family transcriptional regulator
MLATDVVGATALQDTVSALVRGFGLLRTDRTPCGQPISLSAAHALAELACADRLPQTALVSRLRLEKSTVSRLVADLVRRGWVRRHPDDGDGRAVSLQLTAAGAEAAGELQAARSDRFTTIFERIPDEDRSQVLRSLRVLVDAIEDATAVGTLGDGRADSGDEP